MTKGTVVEEVRRNREAYAERFDFDMHAIAEDLRKWQAEQGSTVVSLPPKVHESETFRKAS